MYTLMHQIELGNMTCSVLYSADDLKSGLMTIPVGPSTPATSGHPSLASTMTIRMPFTSVVGDVTLYPLGAFPGQMRFIGSSAFISTSGGASVSLYTAPAAGGTLVATIPTTADGLITQTAPNTSVDVTPASGVGLFLNSATAGIIGELILNVQFGA
jgi:hypothetical protein